MKINLIYTSKAAVLNNTNVNNIIIDLNHSLNIKTPVMLSKMTALNIKNVHLDGILNQVKLLSELSDADLLEEDVVVNITSSKLIGNYLHMQVLTYLQTQLSGEDNVLELINYPNVWREELLARFTRFSNNMSYYAVDKETTTKDSDKSTNTIKL